MKPPLALPRTILTQDVSTVCLQCRFRLSRASLPRKQLFSTKPSARQGAIALGKSRNVWTRDYFSSNSLLKESVMGALGGARPDSPSNPQDSGVTAAAATATATVTTGEAAVQKASELLPHRRRQRERKEREAAANSPEASYPIAPDASAQLAQLSSNLPTQSIKRLLLTYLSLSKPRLSFLVVLTATAAYSLYPVPGLLAPAATATPSLSTLTLLFLTTGTALCSASANAFNMLFEPAHDAKMSRTRNRPLVRKLISSRGALVFAVACGVIGTGALYYGVNPTAAFLGAANIVLYAGIYTPMKRMSVLNTWVGAIVGGIPPLMGWAAAAGQCAHDGTWEELLFGENSAGGWLCAALLFAWQFPHFNSLSWSIRDEYKNAGYRMLAWVNPAQNGRVALRYAVLMFPVCIGLSYYGVTDWSFIVTSSAVNGWMAWKAWGFWREVGQKGTARGLFWASVWHLPLVMVLAMAQKKGLSDRIYRSIFGYPAGDEDDYYYEDDEVEEPAHTGKIIAVPTKA